MWISAHVEKSGAYYLLEYKTAVEDELCRIEKDLGQKIKLAKIER